MAWTPVQAVTSDAGDPTFGATPTAGNVLLAVGAERSGNGSAGTITGWDQRDTINHKPADGTFRMSATVWTRTSDGTEGTVDFPATNVFMVIAEYEPGSGDNSADLANLLIDSAALDQADNGNVAVGAVTTPALSPAGGQFLKVGVCVVKEDGEHGPISFDQDLATVTDADLGGLAGMHLALGLHTDNESTSQTLTATLGTATGRGAMAFYLLAASPADQFLFPTADQAIGSWSAGGGGALSLDVDDDSRVNPTGDGVVITSDAVGNNTATTNADLQLAAGTDPQSSTDHVLRVRWNSNGNSLQAHLELWQGIPGTGTMVAELLSAADVGNTEVENTYTLTAVEADSITDYANLYLRIWGFGNAGGPARSLVVDLVELQIPPAAVGGQNLTETVTDGAGVTDIAALDQGKIVADDTGLTDQSTAALAIIRDAADDVTVTDTITVELVTETIDEIGLTDTVDTSLFRQLSETVDDTVGLTDTVDTQLFRLIAETADDSVAVTDAVAVEQSPAVTDDVPLADTVTLDLGPAVTDQVGLADASVVELAVVLTDTAGMTDTAVGVDPENLARSVVTSKGLHSLIVTSDGRFQLTASAAGLHDLIAETEGSL